MSVLRELLKEKPAETPAEVKPVNVTLDDVKIDDLKREKVRQEQEERVAMLEVRKIEAQKAELFREGVKNPSEREQKIMARRIKSLDLEAQNKDRILQSIAKQAQILDGLIQVKERARQVKESGLAGLVGNIDLGELLHYIRDASVDGEFHLNKFDEILRALGQAESLTPQINEDQDVLDIVRQMQMAREAADSDTAIEQHLADMNKELADKAKARELEASEEDI